MVVSQYKRCHYFELLGAWMGTPLIKVLTGMRRVGKSTLLQQWAEELVDRGLCKKANVLLIECDSLEHMDLRSAVQLKKVVQEFASRKGPKVLLIDEVQLVAGWEKVVNALHKTGEWDLYITGSNSELLSGELATLLSGRFVQIEVFPFSFKEHLGINAIKVASDQDFNRFLSLGGLPTLYHLPKDDRLARETLESIFSTIVLKDVVERYQLRNIALLEKIVRYFFDNIGNLTTAKRIADFCKSQHIAVGVETVQNYVHYLESCYVVHRVRRNDLKGKRILEVNEKLYINDLGLRNAVLRRKTEDVGALLENLVFLELRQRGFNLTVGYFGDYEIDFVAEKADQRCYFQVCYQMADQKTIDREFRPLEHLPDNYPKTVLSLDRVNLSRNGIVHRNLIEWLAE